MILISKIRFILSHEVAEYKELAIRDCFFMVCLAKVVENELSVSLKERKEC